MLKRQTAQIELSNEQHFPLGLSDSDFLETTHNYTRMINPNNTMIENQKHYSLMANRSSLPDLSAFSGCQSDTDDVEVTMRELHGGGATSSRSSHKESDGMSPAEQDTVIEAVP